MAVIEFKTDRSVKGGGFNATYAHVHGKSLQLDILNSTYFLLGDQINQLLQAYLSSYYT